MGVKTMYRAYANDVVYELVPDTTIGSELGWKAARTYSSWGPLAKHAVFNSPVDGIHVMKRFPPSRLEPAAFVPRCHDALAATMCYMASKHLFGGGTVFEYTRDDWETFKAEYFPWNDHVDQYVQRYPGRFENPLQALVTLTYDRTDCNHDDDTFSIHSADDGAMDVDTSNDALYHQDEDDNEDFSADAEAYLDSTLAFDATRLVTLNPAIPNQVAGHSVRHGNNGNKLPVMPYRLPLLPGASPLVAKDIDLTALRMTALLSPPTEDLTELTATELGERLFVRGIPRATINRLNKFDLVCL